MRKLYYLLIALLVLVWACPAAWSVQALAKEKFTVVIDPGHGGGDIGTPHRKQKQDEKKVALNVALKLGKLIEAYNKDVKVIYTRKTDIYPSLPERTQIAKQAKGDLFISIHVNAAPDASARGFETYVFGVSSKTSADEKKRLQDRMADERENLDINGKMVNFDTDIDIETKILCQAQREKHNKQSQEVANDIHKSLIKELKVSSYAKNVNDRGVKPKNLFVLCYSPMPAILIELGYMSNPAEEKFIASDEGQTCFALGIYNGFKNYKRNWDKRQLSNADMAMVETVEPAKKEEAKKPAEPAKKEEAKKPAEPKKEEAKKPEPKKEEAQKPAEPKKEEAKPAEKAQPVSEQPKRQEPASSQSEITWRVQFLTSGRQFKEGDKELKGLWPVYCYKEGSVYKYTYGDAPTQKELAKDMQKVKAQFKDAFPAKFDKDGKRIK